MNPRLMESQLFAQLAVQQPRFRDWVLSELRTQEDFLATAVEPHAMYRAQGQVQRLRRMLALLDAPDK